jgi:threonine aldolase
MVNRMAEDHENARLLAEGLSQNKGVRILNLVRTCA